MTASTKATLLEANFQREIGYIQRYVDLVSKQARIRSADLLSLTETLRHHELITDVDIADPLWQYLLLPNVIHNYSDLEPLTQLIDIVTPRLKLAKASFAPRFDALGAEALAHSSKLLVETANHLFLLNREEDHSDFESHRADLIEALSRQDNGTTLQVDTDTGLTIEQLVDAAILRAKLYKLEHQLYQLEAIGNQLSTLSLSIRLSRPEAEINIWRQGFITLMAVFEATVFDLVRAAFNADFFAVLASFAKNPAANRDKVSKVSLDNIAQLGSFSKLQDFVTEDLLGSKYLKELLFNLRNLEILPEGFQLIAESELSIPFLHLIELVMRRNIHLHNRGLVDDKYLEYNIHKLAHADLAAIDEGYFQAACLICRMCVNALATWVTSLTPATPSSG
jgi:hypothetical protein